MVATAQRSQARTWPTDLRTIRLEECADGAHRSWIMFFPVGKYEHETWGDLNFDTKTLSEMKQNFDERARGIEISVDRDHKSTEGDSTAMGWIERMELRPALSDGTPAGLWGYIRWTDIGLHEIKAEHFKYFSPEYKPEYQDTLTGKTYHNVILGGGLTNRPFLKAMPAIALAEVSRKSWQSVNKSKLPRSCFLVQGDASDKSTWKLPIYEGAGSLDADGHYTKRGALNINGVRAALAAIGGARTGTPMTGVGSGVRAKLQRLLEQYGGSGGDGGSASKAASEGGRHRMLANGAREVEYIDTGNLSGGSVSLMDGNMGGADQVSRKHPNVDDDMDVEEYAEDDDQMYADGEGDQDGGFDGKSDTHGAMTTDGHSHGKYAEHSHDGDGDHSDAPLKEKRGGKQMSARKASEPRGSLALREQVETLTRKLHERDVNDALRTLAPKGFAMSKPLYERIRRLMLSETVRLSESSRDELFGVIRACLSEKATVDMRKLGASYDQESRVTKRSGGSAARMTEYGIGAGTPDDELAVMELAERIALSEGKIQQGETLASLKLADRERIVMRAVKESAR